MRGIGYLAVAGLQATYATALELVDRGSGPSAVGLRIQKRDPGVSGKQRILRRTSPISGTLENERRLYFANIVLGKPPQDFHLALDTGSSDLWVNSVSSPICQYQGLGLCSHWGTYDSHASSTYTFLNSDFEIIYGDGSSSRGDYALDTVSIGGQQLTGVQFGIGYNTTVLFGILGIGYESNEAISQIKHSDKLYPNLPQLMVDQGLIQSNAYSLWLDDRKSTTGTILFGGVDTEKYHGTLQTLPIQQKDGRYVEFLITLSGLSVSVNGQSRSVHQSLPTVAHLDSGTTLTGLPPKLFEEILEALEIRHELSIDEHSLTPLVVDCNQADTSKSIDFAFSFVNITVPISELVLPLVGPDGEIATDEAGSPICVFGIIPLALQGTGALLGDTFLRSAYVVHDLANNAISLAQTNFDATTSHIVEIGKGRGSVRDALIAASPVQAAIPPIPTSFVGTPAAIDDSPAPQASTTATASSITMALVTGLTASAANPYKSVAKVGAALVTDHTEAASTGNAATGGSVSGRQLLVALECLAVALAVA